MGAAYLQPTAGNGGASVWQYRGEQRAETAHLARQKEGYNAQWLMLSMVHNIEKIVTQRQQ
tara:strand:+ start:24663 stop:24845 length:183 start_codon:yes stop_codon:yes gene_type:complete